MGESHPTTVVNSARRSRGLSAVTGIRGRLHETQGYPMGFGEAVIGEWERHRHLGANLVGTLRANDEIPMPQHPVFADLWDDLQLKSLARVLGLPYDRLVF